MCQFLDKENGNKSELMSSEGDIWLCGVVVISNPTVCDVCVFHAMVFGEMN